ncbi:unnamed protein product [Pleuronectes platessa]|uniref:Uncharacterized protein n=1 Tax=Pleuronectes platessa TaxID=8262 RepID=A0A9N7VUC5_PLEPL|nr:unnamed protein product [Pleuronectes platessa]
MDSAVGGVDSGPGLTCSSEPYSPSIVSAYTGREPQRGKLGPVASAGPTIQMGRFPRGCSRILLLTLSCTQSPAATSQDLATGAEHRGLLTRCGPDWVKCASPPLMHTSADRLFCCSSQLLQNKQAPSGHCCLSPSPLPSPPRASVRQPRTVQSSGVHS